ncbi:uncharacterized protein K02A2.6-like [Homalodisca vitripennis]|uniref:uncharacterized protein K02A2.6-like n=1 Tax=Homalodisca vitripennis TaxID=197043 RepID=UPI001EEA604F|nr:uncharacterized protein K02A2.6-like [Homalodisca vitripennis]
MVEDGVVFKGTKVVIPNGMKTDIIKAIHTGHQGIQSCYQRARESLYWPNMFEDLSDLIRSCTVCQSQSRAEIKEPIKSKQIPIRPWEVTAADYFKFKGKSYLVLGDSYSGYFELAELSSSGYATIKQLKSWFAAHGVPAVLESDNMPFNSAEFKTFLKRWGFEQSISSPNFPRANGLAERFVQTAKNLVRRCYQDGTDLFEALLNHRNTPRSPDLGSPAQRLMSRRTQSLVPIDDALLLPSIIDPKKVHQQLSEAREKLNIYGYRGAVPKPEFKPGENLKLRKGHRSWVLGGVIKDKVNPRSYILESKGKLYRRNSQHIAKRYGKPNYLKDYTYTS